MELARPITDPILQEIPPAVRSFLEKMGRKRSLQQGEVLYKQGDEGEALYLVLSGSVMAYRDLDADREMVLDWVQPGEMLGELEFIHGGPRVWSARAWQDAEVVEISREGLQEKTAGEDIIILEFLICVAKILSQRLRACDELYKSEILKGLEDSGANILDLRYLLRGAFQFEVCLTGGETIEGRIVLMTRASGGYQLNVLEESGDLVCIPFESISSIRAKG